MARLLEGVRQGPPCPVWKCGGGPEQLLAAAAAGHDLSATILCRPAVSASTTGSITGGGEADHHTAPSQGCWQTNCIYPSSVDQ